MSNALQCWVAVLSPRQIVTSTPSKEWMVRQSPTLMATVLVFLKVFSRRRASIESVAPVSSTARKTWFPIFMRIQKTKSSSSELPPYSSAGNLTSTPAAMKDLAIQAIRLFLVIALRGGVIPLWALLRVTLGSRGRSSGC